nr:helix-turn-helix transcriptional regulator [Kibdelosporangium sp. MJ126-NF4]CEL15144.1 Putative DNA-binding protein [Kibdelosporangium sp. MJ126-NF4]CTQ93260.1 Putative DNA-binding protein [Kibdelosporangium sp. MJ126-NF4]
MPKVTPTARKLLLGKEMAHLRAHAGMSQTEAAAVLEKRQSKITELESGQTSVTLGDMLLLLQAYGVTDQAHTNVLLELRRGAHQRGRWGGVRRFYNEEFRTMIDLEENCDLIRSIECEVPPGLLQCESFIRAMYPISQMEDRDHRVEARLARQAILHKAEPPDVAFIVSESSLRRMYGSAEVMREQIDYMIKLSKLPNVRLQVLPFRTPVRSSVIRAGFVLLRIPSPGVAGPLELAYTESVAEVRYLDDKKTVDTLDAGWAETTAAALGLEASRKFMREVARDYT